MLLQNGALTFTSKSLEIGDASEEMRLDYSGETLKVAFNGKYLLDFLNEVASDTVELSQESPVSAMLFTDGPQYSYVLMPARV